MTTGCELWVMMMAKRGLMEHTCFEPPKDAIVLIVCGTESWGVLWNCDPKGGIKVAEGGGFCRGRTLPEDGGVVCEDV